MKYFLSEAAIARDMRAIVAAAARAESEERAARVRAAQVTIGQAKTGVMNRAEASVPFTFNPVALPTLLA